MRYVADSEKERRNSSFRVQSWTNGTIYGAVTTTPVLVLHFPPMKHLVNEKK